MHARRGLIQSRRRALETSDHILPGGAVAGLRPPGREGRRHAADGARPRPPRLRHQRRRARLLVPGRPRRVARLRHRPVPGARGGDLRRPQQDRVHLAVVEGPAGLAAVRPDRRPAPDHDLDAVAQRRPGPAVHGHQLLRRSGLHGAQVVGRDERRGPGRGVDLRAAGHHDRAQPRRLFQGACHPLPDRHAGDARRRAARLPERTLRRLHDRRVEPRGRQAEDERRRRPGDPARGDLGGAARRLGASGRRAMDQSWCAGRCSP